MLCVAHFALMGSAEWAFRLAAIFVVVTLWHSHHFVCGFLPAASQVLVSFLGVCQLPGLAHQVPAFLHVRAGLQLLCLSHHVRPPTHARTIKPMNRTTPAGECRAVSSSYDFGSAYSCAPATPTVPEPPKLHHGLSGLPRLLLHLLFPHHVRERTVQHLHSIASTLHGTVPISCAYTRDLPFCCIE